MLSSWEKGSKLPAIGITVGRNGEKIYFRKKSINFKRIKSPKHATSKSATAKEATK